MKKNLIVVATFLMVVSFCFAAINDQANVLTSNQTKQLLKLSDQQTEKTSIEYNFYFINNEEMFVKAKEAASNAPRTVTFVFFRLGQAKMKLSVLASNDIDLSEYATQISEALMSIKPQLTQKAYFNGAETLLDEVSTIVQTAEKENKVTKRTQSHFGGRIIGFEILEWIFGIVIIVFLLILIKRYLKARKSTQCKNCKIPMHMIKGDRNDTAVTREYECNICGHKKLFIKK